MVFGSAFVGPSVALERLRSSPTAEAAKCLSAAAEEHRGFRHSHSYSGSPTGMTCRTNVSASKLLENSP